MFSSSQRQHRGGGGRNDKVRYTRRWYGMWWFGAAVTGANYFTRQEVPPKKQALEKAGFFVHETEKLALSPPFSHRSDLGHSFFPGSSDQSLDLVFQRPDCGCMQKWEKCCPVFGTQHRCDEFSQTVAAHDSSALIQEILCLLSFPPLLGSLLRQRSNFLPPFFFPFDVAPPVVGEGDRGIKSPFRLLCSPLLQSGSRDTV